MSRASIWSHKPSLHELNERMRGSLAGHWAVRFVEVTDHSLAATMPVDETTVQPMGILHGGASAALAESVGSVAGNYCVDQKKQYCVGLDLNINHIRRVERGNLLKATATPFHVGRSTQVWHIEIEERGQKRVAIARLTLAVLTQVHQM